MALQSFVLEDKVLVREKNGLDVDHRGDPQQPGKSDLKSQLVGRKKCPVSDRSDHEFYGRTSC